VNSRGSILIVDDELAMREACREALGSEGYALAEASSGGGALGLLARKAFDLVILDLKMPQTDGMQVLRSLQRESPGTATVVITGYASIDTAVEAMKLGAADFLPKPFTPEVLRLTVHRVLNGERIARENQLLRTQLEECRGRDYQLIGQSSVMRQIHELVQRVGPTDSTVLVTGESGTGKELVARAIHYNSARANAPFIKVNCAALPENLLESEIFGHEKGAFTGAVTRRPGRFELAHRGTLLLDEISEIPLGLQAKLLRVLQEREFERVGGTRPIKVDVRIVATTNRNLDEEIEAKRFREDLFFRLNVIPITLPPLRERGGDVPLLAQHFVERYSRENNRPPKAIAPDALEAMLHYSWPGNVREVQNVIERAIVLDVADEIRLEHLALRPVGHEADDADEIVDAVGRTVAEMERRLILKTLKAVGGNRGKTAELLQISVRTLRNKLNQYRAEGVFAEARVGAGSS